MTATLDFATATQSPEYQWESVTRRYRSKETGRFLSPEVVKVLTLKRIELATTDLQTLGQLLLDGKISLKVWQQQTAESLKILHAQQYLLGVGGQSSIQKEDYLELGRELKNQYQYLRNFATDCTQGTMSVLQFKARLGMYALAAKVSYFAGERAAARRAGMTHGKRVLGVTDYHCADCLKYAGLGTVALVDLILPTQKCACRIQCRCAINYLSLEDTLDLSEIDFATPPTPGQYIVDKNGRWRDPRTGQFISMPDIKDPGVRDRLISELTERGRASEARNLVRDINKIKLLSLLSPQAYNATLDQLKRKYKNNPFALSLISVLQLERGVSNKANAQEKIEELEQLVKNTTRKTSASPPTLKQGLRDIEVKEMEITPDSRLAAIQAQLSAVDVTKLNDAQKSQHAADSSALDAVLRYRRSVEDLNKVVGEINSSAKLSDDDYERLHSERDQIWGEIKSALDEAQGLKNSYLSEPALDDYVQTMVGISRESPGGYKIAVPKDMDSLRTKAAASPC